MSYYLPKSDIFIIGPSGYLPPRKMTNQALIDWMGVNMRPDWISKRTGIETRFWAAPDQAVSDLAYEAAKNLLENYKINPEQIAQLVLATISGDYPSPPSSPIVAHKLGFEKTIGAFDLGAACAGMVTGLHVVGSLVESTGKNHLLIASEIRSKFLSKRDLSATALFGDGASALLMSKEKENASFKLLGTELLADGSVADLISIQAGGSRLPSSENEDPEQFYLKMKKGPLLFLKAVEGMVEATKLFFQRFSLTPDDIDWVVPHQANLVMLSEIKKRLELPDDKVMITVDKWGNTSGTSIPLALEELKKTRTVKTGDKIFLLSAGGGGLTACGLIEAC